MTEKLIFLFRYFFPEICRNCHKKVAEINSLFCYACLSKIKFFPPKNRCVVCGEKVDKICTVCSSREIFFSKSQFLYLYENTSISLMRELKFYNSSRAWQIIKKDLDKNINFGNNIVFLPMPSSRRLVLDLAFYLAKKFQGEVFANIFVFPKERETKKLSLKGRFWHLEKMSINDAPLPEKEKYVLVDDIYTTGATLNKGAKLLWDKKNIPKEKIQVFALFRRDAQRLIPRQ